MYLKGIVASGFKSFADKIDIKLDGKTWRHRFTFVYEMREGECLYSSKIRLVKASFICLKIFI